MNSMRHLPEPLSTEEMELARLLRSADSRVVPSSELDARVLNIARQAVSKPRRDPRWMQWSALAATVALSAVVLFRYQAVDKFDHQVLTTQTAESTAPIGAPYDSPALQSPATATPAIEPSASTAPEPNAKAPEQPVTQGTKSTTAAPKTNIAKQTPTADVVSAPAAAPVAAPVAAPPPPPPMPSPASVEAGAAPMAARAAAPAAVTVAAPEEPMEWLLEIKRLIKAGKTGKAKEELEQFRHEFPDVPVPDSITSALAN